VNFEGRSALVTGGAGGLGAATVRRLHEAGLKVVVFDMDEAAAAALAKELGAASAGGDVNDDAAVNRAVETACDLGPLSVVVNVAGGATGGGRTVGRDGTPHDKAVFVDTMAMNAHGTFNVSRLAAAAMSRNEPDADGARGVIVNTASIAGMEGQTGQLAYSAAKGAILGMTLPMARDLAPVGIRVCAIAPGTMGTPRMTAALPHMKEDPATGVVFPKRMGLPEEFAELVESIARNGYLNGENIRLDGGLRFVSR
jgi:NAD(P)-dependent dehydrogenase (short-subunit alcohol dehydrogenase family)